MESIVITWRELLLVVVLILAVYIAEMLLMLRAGGGLRKPRWLGLIHEKRVELELRAQLDELRQRVDALESGLGHLRLDEPPNETTPYQRAIILARQGRGPVDISETCGISRGEAELIVSIHGGAE